MCCFPFTSRSNQTSEYRKDQSSAVEPSTVIRGIYEALKFSFLILIRKAIKVTENDAEYEFIPETMIVARMEKDINQQTIFFFFALLLNGFFKNSSCLCRVHTFHFHPRSRWLCSSLDGTRKRDQKTFQVLARSIFIQSNL